MERLLLRLLLLCLVLWSFACSRGGGPGPAPTPPVRPKLNATGSLVVVDCRRQTTDSSSLEAGLLGATAAVDLPFVCDCGDELRILGPTSTGAFEVAERLVGASGDSRCWQRACLEQEGFVLTAHTNQVESYQLLAAASGQLGGTTFLVRLELASQTDQTVTGLLEVTRDDGAGPVLEKIALVLVPR